MMPTHDPLALAWLEALFDAMCRTLTLRTSRPKLTH